MGKVRTKFSRFLEKYGVRVQFSVFEISHSLRVLNIVQTKIESDFKKLFEPGDSVFIFKTDHSKTIRYGGASLLDKDLIFI